MSKEEDIEMCKSIIFKCIFIIPIQSITSCRQSSQANKRKSFKVLASKARPTSTHGRPSVQLLNSDDVVLGQYVNEESVPAQTDNERILVRVTFT